MKGSKIIAIGLPESFTTDIEKNSISSLANQEFLSVEWGLTEISMSKEKKGVLWKNLKLLFGL
jgi:hypothetical protein